jgi:hypothetical protein
MKITRKQLRRIIKEEKARLHEAGPPPDIDAPGWHPNDSQEWERNARSEERAEIEGEKELFMETEWPRWLAEFHVVGDSWSDEDANFIKNELSACYDAIYEKLIMF